MNKKILFIATLACLLALVGAVSAFAESNDDATEELDIGEQHQSEVAKVAENLNRVAGQNREISDEVKAIAEEEQNDSEEIKKNMDAIANRGGLKTFFFGSDYKNLGQLRSQLAKTQNHINRLTKSAEKMASSTAKSELESQVSALTDIKTKAEAFATDNENKFSLFGWFVKLFNK